MSAEEKYLIALGNLQSMAIDNTKGSKAVEICANDIRDYLDKYKEVIDKIKEWKKQTLFELNRQYKTFEYWEELFEDLDKLLEEIE